MIDWGIPDWKMLAGYPDFKGLRAQWAWEFLRRNDDYRRFYMDKIAALDDSDDKTGMICEGPEFQEARERFGISDVLPPWLTGAAMGKFLLDETVIYPIYIYHTPEDGGMPIRRFWPGATPLKVKENELYFRVDLDLPLAPQIARINEHAEFELSSTGRKKRRGAKTARAENYVSYLRILDAYETGAKAMEICEIIFPKWKQYSAYERSDKLYQTRKRATHLRDGGYLALAKNS